VGEENGTTPATSGVRTQNRPGRNDLQYIPRYPDPANEGIRLLFIKQCTKRTDALRWNIRIDTVSFCTAARKIFDPIR